MSAPQFDDSDGDGTIDSLMLTQRALVEPDTLEYPGYGDVPVCLFYGQAEFERGATEVGLVHSFVLVGDRAPVEGLAYDDRYMQTFGYFSTERLTWDPAYCLVTPNRSAASCAPPRERPTDWCTSFVADDHPEPVRLPYRERDVRPVVYHAGPGFPEDLKAAVVDVAAEWNTPLVDTVNGLRYWECIDAGGKQSDCEAEADPTLQMFVWCPNNPSLPGDPAVCSTDHTGPEGRPDGIGDLVRVGDLQYHLAHLVRTPARGDVHVVRDRGVMRCVVYSWRSGNSA